MVRKPRSKATSEASSKVPQGSLEGSKKVAMKMLSEGISEERIMTETNLNQRQIWGLKGSLRKQEKKLAEASKIAETDGEGLGLSHPPVSPQENTNPLPSPSPQNQTMANPSNSLRSASPPQVEGPYNFDYDQMGRLEEFIPKNSRKLFKMYVNAFQKENREKWERNNGHSQGLSGYGRSTNPLIRKIDQRVEAMEYISLMKQAGLLPEANRGSGQDDFDKFLKFFQVMQTLQGKGKNGKPISLQDVINLYRTARLDEANIREKLRSAQAPTPANQWSLQVEDLKGKRELDNKKLDWEMVKYTEDKKDARESSSKMWDTVKSAIDGPVKTITKQLGGAAADRVRGAKQNPQTPQIVKAMCPNCKSTFDVNPSLQSIQCPMCGAILSKEKPEEPQPQKELEPLIREVPSQATENKAEPKIKRKIDRSKKRALGGETKK